MRRRSKRSSMPSHIVDFQNFATSIKRYMAEMEMESIAFRAQDCVLHAARLVIAAYGSPQLDEEIIQKCMSTLSTCRFRGASFSEIEKDLLLTDVGPVTFAGITRRTAHSAAFELADMVYRSAWKASNPSTSPPLAIPSGWHSHVISGAKCEKWKSSFIPAPKLVWDVPAVRHRLQKIELFDVALYCEMIRQEFAEFQQVRHSRQEAERRVLERAMIPEQHRTVRTKNEVAEACGISPRSVSRWIESGRLKCAKIEGKCIFDIRELELLASGQKIKNSAKER